MGKQYPRTQRVRKLLKEEISRLMLREVKDVRIEGVIVSDVEVSADLKHASVYVYVTAAEKDKSDVLDGLTSAAGFIRSRLGRELRLFRIPELRFVIDRTQEKAARISQLLQEIREAGSSADEEESE